MAIASTSAIDYRYTKCILISSGSFADDSIASLPESTSDIEALSRTLTNVKIAGIAERNIYKLINPESSQIKELLSTLTVDNDNFELSLIFYFTGHGIIDARGDLFLVMHDTPAKGYREQAISIRELCQICSKMHTNKPLTFIFDCSYSGSSIEGMRKALAEISSKMNFTILASTTSDNQSLSTSSRSVFTRSFINALKTGINKNTNTITLKDIYEQILSSHVNEKLPIPQYYSTLSTEIPFAYNIQFGSVPPPVKSKPETSRKNTQPTSTSPKNYQLENKLLSDNYSLEDSDVLGYDLHAFNLFSIMTDKQTNPPVNIGILAPWGRGKTSLMRKIEQLFILERKKSMATTISVTPPKPNLNDLKKWLVNQYTVIDAKIPYPTVWFNPWNYQSSDMIWAGMANAIVEQVVDQLPSQVEKEIFWFKLRLSRIDKEELRKELQLRASLYLLQFIVWGITGLISIILFFLNKTYAFTFFGFGAILGTFSTFASLVKPNEKEVLEIFNKYTKAPQYLNKLGTFHDVQEDLKKVFNLLVSEKKPMVIFVDDLDRCSPSKIIEVVEAINVFISGEHCKKIYFVLGMDAEIISAYLDVAYEKMKGKVINRETEQGSLGWYFLDKFIQLPFFIPVISDEKKKAFLTALFDQKENTSTAPSTSTHTVNDPPSIAQQVLAANTINESQQIMGALTEAQQSEVEKEILKQQINSDEDKERIDNEILKYASFLNSDPRSLKRFANLLRFYNGYQILRMKKGQEFIPIYHLGKYIVLMLKFPQLIRWLQWDSENRNGSLTSATLKAKIIDDAMNEVIENEEDIDKAKLWSGEVERPNGDNGSSPNLNVISSLSAELSWLKSQTLFQILSNDIEKGFGVSIALQCNVW